MTGDPLLWYTISKGGCAMADVLFDYIERPEIIMISRAVWLETVNEIRSIYVGCRQHFRQNPR